jgi:flavin reductase (DIM6/NTAB) family NADH-FMN oxidoreductase RutF
MPGATAKLVGPFPEGADPPAYDRARRRVLWAMPSGLYVVGSRAGDRRNGMTCNWAVQVSLCPKLVAVAVENDAQTHRLVSEGGRFTLCLLSRDDRAVVRRFVKPVEADLDARTLGGVPFHDTPGGMPVLDQALAWLDCELRQEVRTGDHTLFIGEVVDCDFQQPEDAPVLRMEDTRMSYGG